MLSSRCGIKSTEVLGQSNLITGFTATGRQKKPSEELICLWIADAWREIPTDMIESSFLKCGITNHVDGSEDHLVYETNDELVDDDTFVREMFLSDSESESEFEGFDI